MASQATLGLKDLCRECHLQMRSYAEPLLNACQQSLLGGRLKNPESVRLMFSIGQIMSMLPAEKIPMCLDSMVLPCFQELIMLTQERNVRKNFLKNNCWKHFNDVFVFVVVNRTSKNSYNISTEYDIHIVFIIKHKYRRRLFIVNGQRYSASFICDAKDNANF